jgi:hypothetical protein
MIVPVLWYAAFGALHETAHLLAASALICARDLRSSSSQRGGSDIFSARNYIRAALARHVLVREEAFEEGGGVVCEGDARLRLVRHAGWVASVGLAVLVVTWYLLCKKKETRRHSSSQWWRQGVELAAVVTALEALATDLLQTQVAIFGGASSSSSFSNTAPPSGGAVWLFCGNFGIILVNLAWATRQGERDTRVRHLRAPLARRHTVPPL